MKSQPGKPQIQQQEDGAVVRGGYAPLTVYTQGKNGCLPFCLEMAENELEDAGRHPDGLHLHTAHPPSSMSVSIFTPSRRFA